MQSGLRVLKASSKATLARGMATATLRERITQLIPEKQNDMKQLMQDHGDKILGTCSVAQAVGGMRSVKSMVWETSLLDANEGIRFRGYTIPELQKLLPVAKDVRTRARVYCRST